jgi:hypothetical protein
MEYKVAVDSEKLDELFAASIMESLQFPTCLSTKEQEHLEFTLAYYSTAHQYDTYRGEEGAWARMMKI